jgi:hypothetical protein
MESLRMLEILGPFLMVYAALVALIVPLIVYVIARWRAHRDSVPDPQLGIKVALGYFAVTAFQVALVGVTILFYTLLSSSASEEKSSMYRAAFGLVVPAGIVLASHSALLGRTNQAFFPGVRRLLLGYNLLITGTLGFIALVLAFQALFGKGGGGDLGRIAGAMVLVYGSAWAVVGVQFGRIVLGGDSDGGMPPSVSGGTGTSVNSPTPPAGPQLPALGGGAFPPIDPR